jgi:hypothetical protein
MGAGGERINTATRRAENTYEITAPTTDPRLTQKILARQPQANNVPCRSRKGVVWRRPRQTPCRHGVYLWCRLGLTTPNANARSKRKLEITNYWCSKSTAVKLSQRICTGIILSACLGPTWSWLVRVAPFWYAEVLTLVNSQTFLNQKMSR